jgi:hypothetical protein
METAGEPERPWSYGVSAEQKAEALTLYSEGNAMFVDSDHIGAAEKYRAALSVWKHPKIYGNLATAYIYLDKPVEALLALEQALAFGAEPFDPDLYAQLVTNQKLLLRSVTRITVKNASLRAEVRLDNERLTFTDGISSHWVTVGEHLVVAEQPGHLPFTTRINAVPGKLASVTIRLVPLEEATRYERRWESWKPWAVVASGVAVSAIGIPFHQAARSNMKEFETRFQEACPTNFCSRDGNSETGEAGIDPLVLDLERRATTQHRIAVGTYLLGGATALVGAVLLYKNQPRPVRELPAQDLMEIQPLLGPDVRGAALTVPF